MDLKMLSQYSKIFTFTKTSREHHSTKKTIKIHVIFPEKFYQLIN